MSDTRDYTITMSFHADHATAERLREALNTAVAALTSPTDENTSAFFHLAAETIIAKARWETDPESALRYACR